MHNSQRFIGLGSLVMALGLPLASACDSDQSELGRELEELQAARDRVEGEVEELREELEESRNNVQILEDKLKLARRGLTEEVVEEREDVAEALARAKSATAEEVEQAKRMASNLKQNSPTAKEALSDIQRMQQKAEANGDVDPSALHKDVEN